MSVYFNDTFTGSAGVLESHTPDAGTGWTRLNGAAGNTGLVGDGTARSATSVGANRGIYTTPTIDVADYEIAATIVAASLLASDLVTVYARLVDASNFYYVAVNQSGSVSLFKAVAGSGTQIGSTVSVSVAAASTHKLTLRVVGTALTVLWDDSPIITGTDTAYSAAGKGGIKIGAGSTNTQSDTTGLHLTEFSAADPTGPTPPSIGAISAASSGGTDTITYPAPSAGTNPAVGVRLYEGTTPGGESATAVSTNASTAAGTFTRPSPGSGQKFYFVRAYDNATTPNLSAPSNEVSTGNVTTTVACNDANIVYSPYTWKIDASRAQTVNAGARFRVLLTGSPTAINLLFDINGVPAPVPQILWRVDGGPWTRAEIAFSVPLTLPAGPTPNRVLEVVVASISTIVGDRWSTPTATVKFQGILTTPSSGVASQAIQPRSRRVLVYGDSITEGQRNIGYTSFSKETDRSDAAQAYSALLREMLGAEVGVVGFPGQGVSDFHAASNNVPNFGATYGNLWSGQARDFATSPPDLIVINQGTNDGTTNIQSSLLTIVEALLAATPATTKIALVRPFNGNRASDISAVASATSKPNRVKYIDTTGWWSTSDAVDALHPYAWSHRTQLAPRLATELRKLLNRGASYRKLSDGSLKPITQTLA